MDTIETVAVTQDATTRTLKEKAIAVVTNPSNQKAAGIVLLAGVLGYGAKKGWDYYQSRKSPKQTAKGAVEEALAKPAPVAEAS